MRQVVLMQMTVGEEAVVQALEMLEPMEALTLEAMAVALCYMELLLVSL